jgi:hypothetical protein
MTNPNLNANRNTEVSRLSEFAFGLPSEAPRRVDLAGPPGGYRTEPRRPGKSTAGDVLVSLVILTAAVLGCFGMNSEMVMQHFPRVAVVLHLATPPQNPALASGADAHIKVWVDLKTGLYHCPGSAFYGQTRSGHFLSQAEAQMGNFEPAQRRACTTGAGVPAGIRVARR